MLAKRKLSDKLNYQDFWRNLHNLNEEELYKYTSYLDLNCRSSTIFPVFKNRVTETRLEFLSYWVKKHENNVILKITSRELNGNTISISYKLITKYQANTIFASKEFNNYDGFCGSVEIEIFSEKPPLFTFPAISLTFANKSGSSVVHSCIRSFNPEEKVNDYALNYPQTGFDINFKAINRNYICFFGAKKKKYHLKFTFLENSYKKEHSITLLNKKYGQSHFIFLDELLCKEDKKLFKNPKCSIKHNLEDLFPRFYVGIIRDNCLPTLTHTFFDTSNNNKNLIFLENKNLRANNPNSKEYFDSSFILPIYSQKNFTTSIKSYAQNLNFDGYLVINFLNLNGEILSSRKMNSKELEILNNIGEININEILNLEDLYEEEVCSVYFGFSGKKIPFPKRFKLGLNHRKINSELGSNICFSPLVLSDKTLQKPFTRKWFPLGGPQKYIASLHNTDFLKKSKALEILFNIEFINHKGNTLLRKTYIKANASLFFNLETDKELENFFDQHVGWCLVFAETFFFEAYFFSSIGDQIGGDHAY